MTRPTKEVTPSELAVLEQLWQSGPSTIRQITDALHPDGSTIQYATVQKLLERLEAKGCVTHVRPKMVNVFSACVSREDLVGFGLRAIAEKLCGGSLAPMLTNLVSAQALTRDERQSLRNMLDDLDARLRRSS